MKKIICFLYLFLFTFFAFSENSWFDKVTDFRWSLEKVYDGMSVYRLCENFRNEMYDNNNLSDYEKFCTENILTWETFNGFYNEDCTSALLEDGSYLYDSKKLERLITGRYRDIRSYTKENGSKKLGKWFYVTAGDILSSSLQYLSLNKAMQEGLTIKKYYDRALEEDEAFVFCLINIGQWYFHAPVVSGGGKGKAMDAFKKAEKSAVSVPERFYAKLYLSQSYYEDGNKKKAAELLDECQKLMPESKSVKLFKLLNENGYHYFEYPENRRKINAKLAKKSN